MSNIARMMQRATAGAGGAGLDIDEVFSTHLYDGNGGTQSINNGIDLSGEGGLVWIKARDSGQEHNLYDTERGIYKFLQSQSYAQEDSNSGKGLTAFNSNGFSLNVGNESGTSFNHGSFEYVSWTFRKAPKFFDIVTYTGNGVAGRTIPHNLGCDVGAMFIKRTNVDDNWPCFHRSLGGGKVIQLNVTDAAANVSAYWNSTNPTDSVFTLGSDNATNNSGDTYVAYLFAHNNGNGNFGPDGDQDIIKCGNFTTQSSAFEVDLGFEPQWIMLKLRSAGSWYMYDVMRGIAYGEGNQSTLYANQSYDEFQIGSNDFINPTSTGFRINQNMINQAFGGNQFVIYMAIRRGTLTPPEDATKVFAIDVRNDTDAPMYKSGFVTDFSLYRDKVGGDDWRVTSRLQGTAGTFPEISTAAESSAYTNSSWDWMNGFHNAGSVNTGYLSWMWKRAPGYFDCVAYTGNGTNPHNISHNLGVAPEMMWSKRRDSTGQWEVYYDTGNPSVNNGLGLLRLNSAGIDLNGTSVWGNTHPTDSVFTVGSNGTNRSGADFIMYLFASLAGVSKVGSYTGNGSSQTIDCGFTSGARFVLIKRVVGGSGGWYVWDSVRGIVAGNDPFLTLNNTNAENTSVDLIDPASSGFAVNYDVNWSFNLTGNTYIFYAIA